MAENQFMSQIFIEVWTEGKTDWQLIKKAIMKLGRNINVRFHEFEEEMGDSNLLKRCKHFSERPNEIPLVFIFDHDKKDILNEVMMPGKPYKTWGNNVFSFAIPVPKHRANYENISIEFYFSDDELATKDKNGRRLFTTSEFVEKSGKYKNDPKISIGNKGILAGHTQPLKAKIIDAEIFDDTDMNIALSKAAFTKNICDDIYPFDNFDFTAFNEIINLLEVICEQSRPKINIYLPDFDSFFAHFGSLTQAKHYSSLLKLVLDLLTMSLALFSISTIRWYEDSIINEPDEYRKKVRPLKKVITEDFTKPSLKSYIDLAQRCYYLIDHKAPEEIVSMKNCLDQVFLLGDLGQLIDDLETIFPPKLGSPILVNKSKLQRSLLQYVMPEIAKYSDKTTKLFEETLSFESSKQIDTASWRNAIRLLASVLSPFFTNIVILKSLEKLDPNSNRYIISVKTYKDSHLEVSESFVGKDEVEEYESNVTDLVLADGKSLHLYPFLLVKDNTLYFYRGTTANGYEFSCVAQEEKYVKLTKKKFNHTVFKTGSKQELFWTDVLPAINPVNQIKANIPDEDLTNFVGRHKQLCIIKEEIVEIPNQNGIVYGPGGIGKTALMLRLANEMYKDSEIKNILFNNIIWISAKSDFYDYIFGAVEKRNPQFRSLDQILHAILEFFEFDNLDEYSLDDKKALTLEILKENKILLILDNFETVLSSEVDKIIKFFEIEVKRELRKLPDYFKVIITSRKQIPCGFHQIELKGLDARESKDLMTKLFDKYKRAAECLSDSQQQQLYEATKGIPIVIKHCFAKLYEYNEPFDHVLRALQQYSSEIVQFSFKEILNQIEKKDREQIQLKILILLELVNYPLMIRQIADILEVDQAEVETRIPALADYQCISKVVQENNDKYKVNAEIRLLTRGLAQQYSFISQDIRQKITKNYSVDKQMDYSVEELQIIGIFENYLGEKNFLDAEDFIKAQLKEKPDSIIMNYYYAKFLKERKHEINEAIKILDTIREPSGNHPRVLQLLTSCYLSLEIPNYDKASVYINELQKNLNDESSKVFIAEFYTRWSTFIKIGSKGLDPFEEKLRQSRYKELATQALSILNSLTIRSHHIFYLFAQSYFNLWDNNEALRMINKAILGAEEKGDYFTRASYIKFKEIITEKKEIFTEERKQSWI